VKQLLPLFSIAPNKDWARARFVMPAGPSLVVFSAHLGDLVKADFVFRGIPKDSDGEFRHRARTIAQYGGNGEGNRLIFGLDLGGMLSFFEICEAHPAGHHEVSVPYSPFIRLRDYGSLRW